MLTKLDIVYIVINPSCHAQTEAVALSTVTAVVYCQQNPGVTKRGVDRIAHHDN